MGACQYDVIIGRQYNDDHNDCEGVSEKYLLKRRSAPLIWYRPSTDQFDTIVTFVHKKSDLEHSKAFLAGKNTTPVIREV